MVLASASSQVIYVVGHRNPDADSICSAIAYANLKNQLGDPEVVPARAGPPDAETGFALRYFGVRVPVLLEDATGLRLILVDHNEVGQALPHIDQAEILEVWEHHRIGDLPLTTPIVFHCEPVGATATLIGERYVAREVPPSREMAGVMLAAILSDTLLFRSPTTTERDRAMVAWLAPIAGVDPAAFGHRMLEIKAAAFEHQDPTELVRNDFKEFELGGRRVGIAQVEVLHPAVLAAHKADIVREMRAVRDARGLSQLILMLTDVEATESDLWFVGEDPELFEQAFGPLDDDTIHLPGVISRKKQVLPRLVAVLTRAEEERRPAAAHISGPA